MWDANITATQFKGKLPMQSANNLMGALRERCRGAGVAIPAIFAADYAKFELLPKTWFSTFQSTITTLIPKYVNHTDNSGDWNGQTTIPAWTEATILTAIGDASRLPAPSSQICAKWCFQQYKILNMPRWVKVSLGFSGADIDNCRVYAYGTAADFNAIPWSRKSAVNGLAQHTVVWNNGTSLTIDRVRSHKVYTNSFPYDITMDTYPLFKTYDNHYQNNDYPAALNTYYKIDSQVIGSLSNSTDIYLGDFGDYNLTPDAINTSFGWHCNQQLGILKFTGPNGFGFRDWEV